MPIDIDAFETREDHREPTTSECVLRFLLAHANRAFSRREIAEAIDVAPETVGTNLTRLKQRNLVRHREPYWAIATDRERVDRFLRRGDNLPDDSDEESPSPSGDDTTTHDDVDEPRSHREAATAFFDRAHDAVGDGVESLYLFGSVASGTESPDSDVDVLAVVADDADFAAVDERLLGVAYDVHLEFGVTVEVHAIRSSEFLERKERGEPFVRSVVEEGVVGD